MKKLLMVLIILFSFIILGCITTYAAEKEQVVVELDSISGDSTNANLFKVLTGEHKGEYLWGSKQFFNDVNQEGKYFLAEVGMGRDVYNYPMTAIIKVNKNYVVMEGTVTNMILEKGFLGNESYKTGVIVLSNHESTWTKDGHRYWLNVDTDTALSCGTQVYLIIDEGIRGGCADDKVKNCIIAD